MQITVTKKDKIVYAINIPRRSLAHYQNTLKKNEILHENIFRPAKNFTYDEETNTFTPKEKPEVNFDVTASFGTRFILFQLLKKLQHLGIVIDQTFHTKTDAKLAVDRVAGEIKAKFVSDGFATVDEYNQAYEQAQQHIANFEIVPPMIEVNARVKGITTIEAANEIINSHTKWKKVLSDIYILRTESKKMIDDENEDYIKVAEDCIKKIREYKG